MTPHRRQELLASSRLGRVILGTTQTAQFTFDEILIHRSPGGQFAPTTGISGRVADSLESAKPLLGDDVHESLSRSLHSVVKAGFDLPGFDIKPDIAIFKTRYGKNWTTHPAAVEYKDGQKTLLINYAYFRIHNKAEQVATGHQSGYTSTNHPDHVFLHELGHVLHDLDLLHDPILHEQTSAARDFATSATQDCAKQVSRRAMHSPAEFVAETFAGIVAGKIYPATVQDLYNQLGGPQPKSATTRRPS